LAYVKPILSPKEDQEAINDDLQALDGSYKILGLTLNPKKTKFMLMGLQTPRTNIDLSLNGDKIDRVDKFKYLGVDLDPKLCYVNHVQRIITKCKQAMGTLNRTARKWTSRQVFKKLYSTTIEMMLLYAVDAWYPSHIGLQNSVEKFKKSASKLCANDFISDYDSLLIKLGWKTIGRTAMERRATQAFKYVKGITLMPDDMIKLQDLLDLRRSSRLKREHVLVIPNTLLDAHKTSSLNTIRRIWNNTPPELRQIENAQSFKKAVKSPVFYETLLKSGEYHRMERSI
jgi:hypothetical protein